MLKFTVPVPDPFAPEVIVSQESFENAIQLHTPEQVTRTELLAAPPPGEMLGGLIE
jgi:hypothetical protein